MDGHKEDMTRRLYRLLTQGGEGTPAKFAPAEIECKTIRVSARDGTLLATDLYLPPVTPAPTIAMRTPYVRNADRFVGLFMSFARRGYAVVAQDCRGTNESQPDHWDYYVYESEDSYDLVEWIRSQDWCNGFIASCGSSYAGQTQWCMATHRAMSAIAPHVSGLGVATNTMGLHLFCNGYARTIGKGEGRLKGVALQEIESLIHEETMAGGFFNLSVDGHLEALVERFPQLRGLSANAAREWLWRDYCSRDSAGRAAFIKETLGVSAVGIMEVEALAEVFGRGIAHDAHSLPAITSEARCQSIHAPALLVTGWYDWGLNDALATWKLLRVEGEARLRDQHRLIITPHAHTTLGYHEGADRHPELQLVPSISNHSGVLLSWYQAVQEKKLGDWPAVTYYLMGANEWRSADDWPVPGYRERAFYLASRGRLSADKPTDADSESDSFEYDPHHPTPTVGGSLVSFLYPVGSVDVSEVQRRSDVLVYSTEPLDADLDVVGPVKVILFASTSAVDTDFSARLSDVHPDGRSIQLQNGVLRARYRNLVSELLHPGEIYRFEIDLWATAHRFKAGHRVRVDVASADFPRFDRNVNRGGAPGEPCVARQRVFRTATYPSHLLVCTVESRS